MEAKVQMRVTEGCFCQNCIHSFFLSCFCINYHWSVFLYISTVVD